MGKEAFSLGSLVPIPRPGSEGHESPHLVSRTHNTGLGFPRGFSAVGDPGRAASGDSLLRKAPSVTLGQKLGTHLGGEGPAGGGGGGSGCVSAGDGVA